jgi:hypothetical protein
MRFASTATLCIPSWTVSGDKEAVWMYGGVFAGAKILIYCPRLCDKLCSYDINTPFFASLASGSGGKQRLDWLAVKIEERGDAQVGISRHIGTSIVGVPQFFHFESTMWRVLHGEWVGVGWVDSFVSMPWQICFIHTLDDRLMYSLY